MERGRGEDVSKRDSMNFGNMHEGFYEPFYALPIDVILLFSHNRRDDFLRKT
jgi:hypothetical protein